MSEEKLVQVSSATFLMLTDVVAIVNGDALLRGGHRVNLTEVEVEQVLEAIGPGKAWSKEDGGVL